MARLFVTITIFTAAMVFTTITASAAPPNKPKAPPADPAIELRLEGKHLRYSYDLSTVFDKQTWRVLEDNGYSDIAVEVRLLDADDKVKVTQYHTLKIELLDSGRVRVMTSPRRGKIYKNRAAAMADLRSVPGRPIRADDFAGEAGHLEITVLVNPVQVFAFPDEEAPLADRRVVPRTYYDRKMQLRSRSLVP